jgi:hypothetical protein
MRTHGTGFFPYQMEPMVRALWLLVLIAGAACASRGADPSAEAAPAPDVGPMRVLVLPIQGATEDVDVSRLGAEIVFALRAAHPRIDWVAPEDLRRVLRRAPQLALDPDRLPSDPLLHGGERRAGDQLGAELRRYSALVDARDVLLARIERRGAAAGTVLRGAIVDSRTLAVVRHTEIPAEPGADRLAGLADLAERFARRILPGAAW